MLILSDPDQRRLRVAVTASFPDEGLIGSLCVCAPRYLAASPLVDDRVAHAEGGWAVMRPILSTADVPRRHGPAKDVPDHPGAVHP